MNQTRVMPGIINMEGSVINSLQVGRLVQRHPRPRYETTCSRCGARSTAGQDALTSGAARCRAGNCGKTERARSRDLLSEQRQQIAERENQRRADELSASDARMKYESEGHELGASLAEQQSRKLRQRRDQEERAALDAIEAPRREAEQKRIAELQTEQENTLRQIHALRRERIANGVDDEFEIDPATLPGEGRGGIPADRVKEWQAAQFTEFLTSNPGYYRCDENGNALTEYLTRNCPGLRLISARQLTAAYKRLSEFGLLKERPAPKLVEQQPKQRVNLGDEPPPKPPQEEFIDGWDLVTGEPRRWRPRELDRLSSDDYRRALRLYPDQLTLPNVGPGPKGYAR